MEHSDSDFSDDDDQKRPEREVKTLFPPSKEDAFEYLNTVWDELNPPATSDFVKGKIVGVIYYEKTGKPHFFIGKILQRMLYDVDGPAKEFEIEVIGEYFSQYFVVHVKHCQRSLFR